jgi:transcriptional regulator NrdR family protein
MTCPRCGALTDVVDSRMPLSTARADQATAAAKLVGDQNIRWRRRKCAGSCGYRFNTIEVGIGLMETLVRGAEQ